MGARVWSGWTQAASVSASFVAPVDRGYSFVLVFPSFLPYYSLLLDALSPLEIFLGGGASQGSGRQELKEQERSNEQPQKLQQTERDAHRL
jgi:hypothetical protein